MKKWIAMKMFDLAVRLDWDGAVEGAKVIVLIDGQLKAAFAPKKKMGRPVGSKNKPKVASEGEPAKVDTWRTHAWVPTKKKMGRPLGSKNKPKVQP